MGSMSRNVTCHPVTPEGWVMLESTVAGCNMTDRPHISLPCNNGYCDSPYRWFVTEWTQVHYPRLYSIPIYTYCVLYWLFYRLYSCSIQLFVILGLTCLILAYSSVLRLVGMASPEERCSASIGIRRNTILDIAQNHINLSI